LTRWAAEGLSFLTLDAEVKEKLVEDESVFGKDWIMELIL
jgi:hypothetical protein